ncbi:MAG: hypothetical protein KDN18_21795 [Verrucomicrobiae bacterium]|nr:hypothetical protein [Verrucomicrobiae bacterium]
MKPVTIFFACLLQLGVGPAFSADPLRLLHVEFSMEHRFIFYAVLEGAYEEGLSEETVSTLLGEKGTEHFVIGCPICMPAYEALAAYRDAPRFTSKKMSQKGFGTDLPAEEQALLLGPVEERRKLVRTLVSRWIEARFALLNLPADREKALRDSLLEMSEKGTALLEHFKKGGNGDQLAKDYVDWEFCPSCSGATLHGPASGKP